MWIEFTRSTENDAGGLDESSNKLRSRPAIRQAVKATPLSIEKPRRDLNASQTSLFGPTSNNTAAFDFTLSEDDQLMIGLSRFGKETVATKVKTMKKPPGGGTGIVG
nr:hypothetical protein HmN_000697100 [Hymenolepis microstoma]